MVRRLAKTVVKLEIGEKNMNAGQPSDWREECECWTAEVADSSWWQYCPSTARGLAEISAMLCETNEREQLQQTQSAQVNILHGYIV